MKYPETECRSRGLLTPQQIKQLRQELKFSREAFAELTGFGTASIKRWENASLVQNQSADCFLRLLKLPGVIERLTRLRNNRR